MTNGCLGQVKDVTYWVGYDRRSLLISFSFVKCIACRVATYCIMENSILIWLSKTVSNATLEGLSSRADGGSKS